MDKSDPRRWRLQPCKILGQRNRREDEKPMELAQAEDEPGMENWDRLLREKKKKDKEAFLKRWPGGYIGSIR